jgi:hypothetical protein
MGSVAGWDLGGFVRWVSSRVYEGSGASACEGVGYACAAHDYGYDIYMFAGQVRAECVCKGS